MRRSTRLDDSWQAVSPAEAALPSGAALGPVQAFRFQAEREAGAEEVELHIEGPSRDCAVYLNGVRAGGAQAFVPAEFVVGRLLQPGENIVAFVFTDEASPNTPDTAWLQEVDPRQFLPPQLLGRTCLVHLPPHRIEQVRLSPDFRRAQLDVEVATTGPGTLHIRVDGASVHEELQAGGGLVSVNLQGLEPWSPGAPQRHELVVDFIHENGQADRVTTSFGLRDFTVKEEQFHWNLRPVLLRGAWHAPVSLPEPLPLLRELIQARLNTLRLLWADEATLSAADELGLAVLVQWPRGLTPEAAAALVNRYHHHPSLVGWWLLDGPDEELAALWQADASRLVIASKASGGACYYRPRKQTPEPSQHFRFQAAPPFEVELESYWRRMGDAGKLVLVESFSAFGLDTEPSTLPAGLDGVCDSTAELMAASQGLQGEAVRYPIDAFRVNPMVAGYWIQGLQPFAAWPNSALAQPDGASRPVLRIIEALHRRIRPVIQMERSSLQVREEVHVSIVLLNDARVEGRGEIFLQVIGPTNQVLWKKRRLLRIPKHGKELWSGSVAASGSIGKHKFVVRLLQDDKVLGDSVFEFHVMEQLPEARQRVHVVDVRGEWEARLKPLATVDNLLAPVHVLPPAPGSVFAHPDNELMQSLAQVRGGGVLLVFSPPADWNALAQRLDGLPTVTLEPIAGTGVLHHPYVRSHPIWEGLPARGFLRQPYRETCPPVGLVGESDEAIAGWITGTPDDLERHTLLSVRYGQGRIVFVAFRLLQHLGSDSLADRAFVNLLQHFTRRSVPPRQPLPIDQRAVEWMRAQRKERVRRWMVIGEFPNEQGEGIARVFPPEQSVDLEAAYPGWRRLARWEPWYTHTSDTHLVDLSCALAPPTQPVPRQDYSTAYAYTEFNSERRLSAFLSVETPNAVQAWLNGKSVLLRKEGMEHTASPPLAEEGVVLKQGRNTLLLKLCKAPGPFWFRADFQDNRSNTTLLNWWR